MGDQVSVTQEEAGRGGIARVGQAGIPYLGSPNTWGGGGGGGGGCMRNANGHLVVPEIAAKTAARHSPPGLSLSLPLATVILI